MQLYGISAAILMVLRDFEHLKSGHWRPPSEKETNQQQTNKHTKTSYSKYYSNQMEHMHLAKTVFQLIILLSGPYKQQVS